MTLQVSAVWKQEAPRFAPFAALPDQQLRVDRMSTLSSPILPTSSLTSIVVIFNELPTHIEFVVLDCISFECL